MDKKVKTAIERAVKRETFARALNMEWVELDDGHSVVEMTYDPRNMGNMYDRAHGGALFELIDEAFETACQQRHHCGGPQRQYHPCNQSAARLQIAGGC